MRIYNYTIHQLLDTVDRTEVHLHGQFLQVLYGTAKVKLNHDDQIFVRSDEHVYYC